MSLFSAVAVFIVIGVVAAIAAPKSKGTSAASAAPAASATPVMLTDPAGNQCTGFDSAGYCPGQDPTQTPTPGPSGPQQVTMGQSITITDTSAGTTEGTVTVVSASVTTQPAQSFANAPANGFFVVVHISAAADQSYTSGFNVSSIDFYVKSAGQHYTDGNGNAFGALTDQQSNQNISATLAAGETASGWIAFDVPRPHGFVVYAPNFNGQPLAEWAY